MGGGGDQGNVFYGSGEEEINLGIGRDREGGWRGGIERGVDRTIWIVLDAGGCGEGMKRRDISKQKGDGEGDAKRKGIKKKASTEWIDVGVEKNGKRK